MTKYWKLPFFFVLGTILPLQLQAASAALEEASPASPVAITAKSMDPRDTELLAACFKGDVGAVRRCLAAGANIDAMTDRNVTSLMVAAYKGHMNVVVALSRGGANVNAVTLDGGTVLMWAVHGGDIATVSCLAGRVENINAVDSHGESALKWAMDFERPDIAKMLGMVGAILPESPGLPVRPTMEMSVAEPARISFLDRHPSSVIVAASDNRLDTELLTTVCCHGTLEDVRACLDAGANVNVMATRDMLGASALRIALISNLVDIGTLLCQRGAEVNLSLEGKTMLMWAVEDNFLDFASILCTHGADLDAKDKDGKTALMLARENMNGAMVMMLSMARATREMLKQLRDAILLAAAAAA